MTWIKVTERLPESGERVLFAVNGFVGEGYWDGKKHWVRYPALGTVEQFLGIVTHWMPLPQYKGEEIKTGHWFCDNCNDPIKGKYVTYEETCTFCGDNVYWVEGSEDEG